MKRVLLALAAVFFLLSCAAYADEKIESAADGRYQMYIVTINTKPTPFLLDTRTGKVWYYSEGQSSGLGMGVGEKPRFKGVTVEGLSYSSADMNDLVKQIDAFHTAGFINKTLLGFNERLNGAYSYSVELDNIKELYEKAKLDQPKRE